MSTKTTSGKIKIAYTVAGKGDTTLLLLPGWCANRTKFEGLIPGLSQHYRVISVDWRGHGESAKNDSDFGVNEQVEDALSVINETGSAAVIPVSVAHAGWAAIGLREKLGSRIPKLVFMEWMVFDAPPPFLDSLKAMQDKNTLKETLDFVFGKWINNVDNPKLVHFVRDEMGAYPYDMWSRGAREIGRAYGTYKNPLNAVSNLKDKPSVMHLYGQPDDPGYLKAQEDFSKANPWFSVQKLNTKSHFPMFESSDEIVKKIIEFCK
ncbi:MAG TPA: alpha/beta hydrolase [Ignavibacteria bacterium]|jgi:pimeloyl-ACP methyl ester carboxylesterase